MSVQSLKILSLSLVYPTPEEPQLGIFVKRRLDHMAALAEIRIVAPAPAMDYAKLRAGGGSSSSTSPKPPGGKAASLETNVFRPRWWYPPGGGALNPPLMALQILPLLRRLRREEFRFDLIDAHFGYPTGAAAAILSSQLGNCPFTITLRGDETMHAGFGLRSRWMDWALRRATAIFAVSGRLRDWAVSRGGVSPERAFTIPNGIDNQIFRLLPGGGSQDGELSQQVRAGINPAIKPGDRMVLSVGYLIERKGHHHLIRAVHQLGSGGARNTHVVIAGEPGREGNFADHLRELAHTLGMEDRVHFIGRQTQPQIARLMNAADLFVLASSREGWPNVVQEALACGCPVIASDIGGTPDMIPDARYGYLLPENQDPAKSLPQALTGALTANWNRPAIAEWGGRRSWNQVAADVIERMSGCVAPSQSHDSKLQRTIKTEC